MNRYKDQEMDSLFAKIYALGAHTERALRDAVWALAHYDGEIARNIVEGDDSVDDLALEINTLSFELIARYQPVAFDLRALEACIRMALELERITDLAVGISRVTLDLDVKIRSLEIIQPMGERVVEMLNAAMSALTRRDVSAAEKIFAMDDDVDDYEDAAFTEIMEAVMETPSLVYSNSKLITVPRLLERAGDHVTNITEQICYMLVGRRVKASKYRRPMPGEEAR
jgi:phosphate transport system protein